MKRQTMIAVGVAALVVVLGWYMFSYRPKGADLAEARKDAKTAEAQEAPLRTDLARLQALDRERPLREAELQRLVGLIPERDELAGFFISADEIATRSGLRWNNISASQPAAAATAGQPSVIALSIQVEGGFFQLLDYLGRMERLRRLVVIDSIQVSPSGGDEASGTSGNLAVTLSARMFTTALPGATTTTVATVVPTTLAGVATTTVPGPATTVPAPTTTSLLPTTTVGG